MRTFITSLLAAAFVAGVCTAETFTLKIGESHTIEGSAINVSFVSITEDSRCPSNVTCIWEGDAAAMLQADAQDFTLHTASSLQNSIEWSGFTISLDAVAPYPEAEISIDPEDYAITLTAVPTAPLTAASATWGSIKTLYR